jgi:phosphonate transport system permease protein
VRPKFRVPRKQLVALAVDWTLLLYLSYCVFFLINHWYRALVLVSPVYRVPFPPYGYPVAIIATLLLAVLWQNLGTSIGWKGAGLVLVRSDGGRASFGLRLRRMVPDLVTWALAVVGAALLLLPLVGLLTLLNGVARGAGISFLPGLALWPRAAWPIALGEAALSLLALALLALGVWLVVNALWGFLWPARKGREPWCDRIVQARAVPASELEVTGPKRRWWKTSFGLVAVLLIALTVHVGWLSTEISLKTLARRAATTGYLWGWIATPDFTYFADPDPAVKVSILGALIETVFMALMATALGLVFAFPLSFLGARNIMTTGPLGWLVYTVTRGFFNVVRSIETIIWAVVFAVWVRFGPFAGVLALTVHTIAALGKLYSEQVEAVDPGPMEAMTASGARRWQVIRYGVIPQVVPSFLAFTLYRWDINVRMSTVIGLVGGGGIGTILFYYKDEILWHQVGAVMVSIAAVVWLMDYVSGRVRERID